MTRKPRDHRPELGSLHLFVTGQRGELSYVIRGQAGSPGMREYLGDDEHPHGSRLRASNRLRCHGTRFTDRLWLSDVEDLVEAQHAKDAQRLPIDAANLEMPTRCAHPLEQRYDGTHTRAIDEA